HPDPACNPSGNECDQMTPLHRVLVVASALSLLAVPATATGGRPATFSGACDFHGIVRFDPPLTNTAQPVSQYAQAPGSCSGTFVDRKGRSHMLSDAPVTYVASSTGTMSSCVAGVAQGAGR